MLSLEERRRKRRREQQKKNEERRQQLLKQQEEYEAPAKATEFTIDDKEEGGTSNDGPAVPQTKPGSTGWLSTTSATASAVSRRKAPNSGEDKARDYLTKLPLPPQQREQHPIEGKPSNRSLPSFPPFASNNALRTTDGKIGHILPNSLTSPQSSVSFSQDTTTTNQTTGILSNDKAAVPASRRKRLRRARSDSSSSSDGSFDIMQWAALKEKPVGAEQTNTGSSSGDQAESSIHHSSGKPEPPSSLEMLSTDKAVDDTHAKSSRGNVRKPGSDIISELDRDSADNEQLSERPTPDSKTSSNKSRRLPRNPLTLMKEDQKCSSIDHPVIATTEKAVVDHLWEDPDDQDEGQDLQRESRSQAKEKKPKKRRKKVAQLDGSGGLEKSFSAERTLMDEPESEIDPSQLKPEFETPKFGPFDLEPLVLSSEESEHANYKVPASISRYLPPYQREGIEFMFNAITTTRGAILGHDMGLGKTIQTVSLVAALLQKKGTMEDLLEIRRREKAVATRKRLQQEALDEALQSGKAYTDPFLHQEDPIARFKWAPILILAPSSVMVNWKTDFGTWGHFSIASYDSASGYTGVDKVMDGLAEIMVSSHNIFMSNEHFNRFLEVPWKLVVIDEYHLFKNETAIRSKHIRKLRDSRRTCIIGLTGTLMQNDHYELWNLVDIVAPSLLGNWSAFQESTAKPIKWARTKDATDSVIELGRRKSEELQLKLDAIHHRKTKESVLKDHLPRKDERIVFCDPSPLQKAIYKHVLQQPDFVLVAQAHTPCCCGVNKEFFSNMALLRSRDEKINYFRNHKNELKNRAKCCFKTPTVALGSAEIDPRAVLWKQKHPNDEACQKCPFCIIFPTMHILFKLSTHVGLIQPQHPPESLPEGSQSRRQAQKEYEIAKAFIPPDVLQQLQMPSLIRQKGIMMDHFVLSGKMKVLAQLLEIIERREGRVLLFSASTSMLDIIETFVQTTGYTFLRMDGATPQAKRSEIAEEFKANPDIFLFLLSTKAMGLGLNLTSASWVIIFDVEWNPSYDKQAQDRSYRIGQNNDVKVFRLVSSGTIEELRYLRQVYKTQLENETLTHQGSGRDTSKRIFRGVAGDTDRRGELFGMTNLLRFNETGTFMNYGPEATESNVFKQPIFDMSSFLSVAQAMSNDLTTHAETSAIQMASQTKAEDRNLTDALNEESKLHHSTETQMVGGESQACLDICGLLPEKSEITCDEKSLNDETSLLGGRSEACLSSHNKNQNDTTRRTATSAKTLPGPNSQDTTFSRANKDGGKLLSTSVNKSRRNGPVANKNNTIEPHLSTNAKTTFSVCDLALPGGFRKKKKKKKPM